LPRGEKKNRSGEREKPDWYNAREKRKRGRRGWGDQPTGGSKGGLNSAGREKKKLRKCAVSQSTTIQVLKGVPLDKIGGEDHASTELY